jgi:hypothetical protein
MPHIRFTTRRRHGMRQERDFHFCYHYGGVYILFFATLSLILLRFIKPLAARAFNNEAFCYSSISQVLVLNMVMGYAGIFEEFFFNGARHLCFTRGVLDLFLHQLLILTSPRQARNTPGVCD